jgi:hypothetical protein
MKGYFGAVVLVVAGILLLLSNLGVLNVSVMQLVQTWWPLVLIALGVGLFFTPRDKNDRQ